MTHPDKMRDALKTYEPVVVIEESRGRLTANGAAMEAKPGGRWVRFDDVLAALAAPAQPDPWRAAVEEAMLAQGLDIPSADADATASVTRLVAAAVETALDPAVSARAQALEERERCAQLCEALKGSSHEHTNPAAPA